jgi:hypothetical protein
MLIILYILITGTIISLTVMGVSYRNSPQDPYEKEEEENFITEQDSKEPDYQIKVVIDDGEIDEELGEDDNQNEEDQD